MKNFDLFTAPEFTPGCPPNASDPITPAPIGSQLFQPLLLSVRVNRRAKFVIQPMQSMGRPAPPPFRYFDKGNMAVIGRGFAVLDSGRVKLSGIPAWLAWTFIHLMFLPAGGNRLRVWTQWLWSYFTRQRSSQLIVEQRGGQAAAHPEKQPAETLGKVYENAQARASEIA